MSPTEPVSCTCGRSQIIAINSAATPAAARPAIAAGEPRSAWASSQIASTARTISAGPWRSQPDCAVSAPAALVVVPTVIWMMVANVAASRSTAPASAATARADRRAHTGGIRDPDVAPEAHRPGANRRPGEPSGGGPEADRPGANRRPGEPSGGGPEADRPGA